MYEYNKEAITKTRPFRMIESRNDIFQIPKWLNAYYVHLHLSIQYVNEILTWWSGLCTWRWICLSNRRKNVQINQGTNYEMISLNTFYFIINIMQLVWFIKMSYFQSSFLNIFCSLRHSLMSSSGIKLSSSFLKLE